MLDQFTDTATIVHVGRLLLAALLGGLLGLEREFHGRPAGFRTHLLVSLGACLMMLISESFVTKYAQLDADSVMRLDPARVAAQIVTGIGFLGAGVIIKEGFSVRGLTTAACLWCSAGIGMGVGTGYYLPAVAATLLALCALLLLKDLERLLRKDRYRRLTVHCAAAEDRSREFCELLRARSVRIVRVDMDKDLAEETSRFDFLIIHSDHHPGGELVDAFAELPAVTRVRFH